MGTGSNSFNQGPFSFGPSGFDMQSIVNALTGNKQATVNRYKQLGLGSSPQPSAPTGTPGSSGTPVPSGPVTPGIPEEIARAQPPPSTMLSQDLNFQDLAANALIGQEQNAGVTNPAINPALQSPISTGNPTKASSIGNIFSGLSGH